MEKVLVRADTFASSVSLDFPLFDVSVFKTAWLKLQRHVCSTLLLVV